MTPTCTPLRGQYGELADISVRYAHLDDKVRGEVLHGESAVEKLGQLLSAPSPMKSA